MIFNIKLKITAMKTKLIIILAIIFFQSCKTKKMEYSTSFPKIENQITGELDYTKGGFELVQWEKNGREITVGRIDETGEVYFNLQEYDIQSKGKNHTTPSLEGQFNMIGCSGKGKYNMMGDPLRADA